MTPDLRHLQERFQRLILSGDGTFPDAVSGTSVTATTRLAVYSNAYRLRLTEALAANFPRLQEFLMPPSFAQIARDYIDRFPSRSASVRWFGDRVPQFLGSRSEFLTRPWVAELAEWEWQLAAAFDAADAAPLAAEALSRIAPDEWPDLGFVLHPSMRLTHLRTNAALIFKALDEGQSPPAACVLDQPQAWLIWRSGLTVRFRQCGEDEAAALQALVQNDTFAAMCDLLCSSLAESEVPARAASLLRTWVSEGLIAGCTTGSRNEASVAGKRVSGCLPAPIRCAAADAAPQSIAPQLRPR